jgi:hypothetical protein
LAMRDLEIRGAGNVLGVQQHGHVAAIGFEMYCKMLKEAVETMRDGEAVSIPQCKVEAPYECFIPGVYIDDPDERMLIYKRLAGMTKAEEVDAIEEEMVDRFGKVPRAATFLLDLTRIKLIAGRLGIVLVQIREPGYKAPTPEALERAADVPRSADAAPRGVPRALHGLNRLKRLAEKMNTGGLGGMQPTGKMALEFGPGRAFSPDQCGRIVETFGDRLLFKSGKSFGLTLTSEPGSSQMADTKNLLQVAYFSTTIEASSERGAGT